MHGSANSAEYHSVLARRGARRRRAERRRNRRLMIEPLESRQLMDAGGVAPLVAPLWFEDVAGDLELRHAGVSAFDAYGAAIAPPAEAAEAAANNLYDWIVQFDTAALAGINSVAETASLLVGGGVDFQVIRGLGLVGQVLVRSSGADFDAVHQWLDANVNVAYFEQDAIGWVEAVPNDSQYGQLWGMTAIDAPAAWNLSTGGSGVVVAVIDTGVDYNHVDLAANIWTNPGEIPGNGIDDDGNGFIDDVHGYNFINNSGNPMDDHGHGTHVAGTIAAVGNNASGVAGVNWSSSIMVLKFLDANGSGSLSDAVRAINYATMMRTRYGVNVRVMNNSWGGGGYYASLYNAIQASNNADILFVAAAGNDGKNTDASPSYPAGYNCANVISVAAVDSNYSLASFSNYGVVSVDLAAPGVSIYSTVPGNRYAYYSGTSMASPHVAGVAALAFAAAPNATMTQVRNAILQGAKPVSTLAGKVATGGVLNAYNTLQRLGVQAPQGPSIGALALSANPAMLGATVSLIASGITASSGSVAAVRCYWDANGNGQLDASDPLLASTGAVSNGQATLAVATSTLGVGTHRLFVQAADSNARLGSAVSATLTVNPPDDHGNSAAAATLLTLPANAAGMIGALGDVDWFKFQAVAGKSYVFSTALGTLADSVLSLYNTNGVTQLAYNDDAQAGTTASRISWTAPASGTYYIAVAAYGSRYTGSYTLAAQMINAAPTLAAIGDRTMSRGQTTLSIPISAADADGDRLTYTVQALTGDPLAKRAYEIDQQWGLYQWDGSYFTNLLGAQEKYIRAADGSWFFILPSGDLYRWGGSIQQSTLYASFNASYYANPALLHAAPPPSYTQLSSSQVAVSMSGNALSITRAVGFANDFFVRVSVSDGAATTSETFRVAVTNAAPTLQTIGDRTMSRGQTTLLIPISAADADGDRLTYTVQALTCDPLAKRAYEIDQQWGLYQWDGSYFTNLLGAQEKYIRAADGSWFFILPGGDLYRWGGSIQQSTLYASFNASYYANPALLHAAPPPSYTQLSSSQVAVSMSGNALSITRAANYTGDFYVRVSVSDGAAAAAETFRVSLSNAAPTLAAIGDRTMSAAQTSLSIQLSAADADGDPLSYSAQALACDPLAKRAYEIDQQWGLYQWDGSYFTNLLGAQEKYIRAADGSWFFMLPGGDLYRWGGSIQKSTLYASFNASYYANPALLHEAPPPSYATLSAANVSVVLSGNTLNVVRSASYTNEFIVGVNVSDGLAVASRSFRVQVAGSSALAANSLAVAQSASPRALSPPEAAVSLALERLGAAADFLADALPGCGNHGQAVAASTISPRLAADLEAVGSCVPSVTARAEQRRSAETAQPTNSAARTPMSRAYLTARESVFAAEEPLDDEVQPWAEIDAGLAAVAVAFAELSAAL
jgi:subtilisin family serine protease